ncbi:MAG: hypothetical protein EOO92_18200 [Pedobacter sp.]|nr:MAG: hypothetical protein EOO92_18200 [Pedobacter sp.]
MASFKETFFSKKAAIIYVVIIAIVIAKVSYDRANRYKYYEVKLPVAIQLYKHDVGSTQQWQKYKLIPAGTIISVAPELWAFDENTGYYYSVKDNTSEDIFAEEKINKYLPLDIASSTMSGINYYAVFPINEYNSIPANFKSCISDYFMANAYHTNKDYGFTTISNRARDVIAYGRLTGEAKPDMAILIENAEARMSKLVIFNEAENLSCHAVYEEEFTGLPIINSFKKGALIYKNTTEFVKSPLDGIIVKDKNNKFVILYDPEFKRFVRDVIQGAMRAGYDSKLEMKDLVKMLISGFMAMSPHDDDYELMSEVIKSVVCEIMYGKINIGYN